MLAVYCSTVSIQLTPPCPSEHLLTSMKPPCQVDRTSLLPNMVSERELSVPLRKFDSETFDSETFPGQGPMSSYTHDTALTSKIPPTLTSASTGNHQEATNATSLEQAGLSFIKADASIRKCHSKVGFPISPPTICWPSLSLSHLDLSITL